MATTATSGAMAIEAGVQQLTNFFHSRLQSLHITSFYDDYGPGTHSWPYWARDLRQSIGQLMADFAHPTPAPARVSYTIRLENERGRPSTAQLQV